MKKRSRSKPTRTPRQGTTGARTLGWLRRIDPLNLIAGVAGLLWLGVAVFGRPIGDYGVETDFYGDFIKYAREWFSGEPSVMNGFRGPVYYLITGFLDWSFLDAFTGAKILSAVSAAVVVRLAGGLVRTVVGPTAGLIAALFFAGNPAFIQYSFRACTDPFFLALFLGCLTLLLAEGDTPRRWALAGLLAGLAWLTRYNGLALVPAAVVIAAVSVRPLPRAATRAAIFLGVWLLVMAPWALYLWSETGDPLWSKSFQNVAIEVFVSNPAFAQQGQFMSAVGFETLGEVVRTDPGRFLVAMGRNSYRHVIQDAQHLVGIPWAVLALCGFAVGVRTFTSRRGLAFLLAGAATYASLLPVFYSYRFMLPLLLWWAVGLGALGQFLLARLPSPGRAWIPVAAAILAMVIPGVIANVREVRVSHDLFHGKGPPVDVLELSRDMRTKYRFDATTPVAARKPHIGYYLGCPVVPIPTGQLSEMQKQGIKYLLVSGAEVNAFRSLTGLWRAAETGEAPPPLQYLGHSAVDAGEGRKRVATFFGVRDSEPHAPAPRAKPSREVERIAGLSRIETLRVRLVRWYLEWDRDQPAEALLSRLGPDAEDNPEVLIVRGDLAVRQHDLAAADDFYAQAAAAGVQDEFLLMRRLTVRYLADDLPAFQAGWDRILEQGDAGENPDWVAWGGEAISQGSTIAAVAPFAACLLRAGRPVCMKHLGRALNYIQWTDKGNALLEVYRKAHPDDPELVPVVQTKTGR